MTTKEKSREIYLKIKDSIGRTPKATDFYEKSGINNYTLTRLFGRNPYSKLQEYSGDKINKLQLERVPLEKIFTQYGELVRKYTKPIQADWMYEKCTPPPMNLPKKPHYIAWPDLPIKFVEFAKNKPEWHDVVQIIEENFPEKPIEKPEIIDKEFSSIIESIKLWTPKRRRNSEEGYKIELREFLEKSKRYSVAEETGESNVDLVINSRFAIELKKNPSLAEYDRLFGQIARHFNTFDYVIALICDVSSDDRYRQFERNIDDIYGKLNLNIFVITK